MIFSEMQYVSFQTVFPGKIEVHKKLAFFLLEETNTTVVLVRIVSFFGTSVNTLYISEQMFIPYYDLSYF